MMISQNLRDDRAESAPSSKTGRRLKAAAVWTRLPFLTLMASLLFPITTHAHIKWFEAYDITRPPRDPADVLTPTFVWFFVISAILIYVFFLVDRFAFRRGILSGLDERLRMFDSLGVLIMRAAGGLFFLSVFVYGQIFGVRFYLTPELLTDAVWVPWVQLLIGLAAIHPRTTPLMFPGILILYGAAIAQYGLFHVLDYMVFLAIGYFYLATSIRNPRWIKSGFVTLFAVTGINFMWLAVEKFAYPYWTFPLLEKNPDLLMGIDPQTYMNLAGFVEMMIIFTLLGAVSVVTRLIAFAFQMLFVLAIFKFGLIDAIGHLMIIAILFVLVIRGPTEARYILVLREKSLQMEAYFMTGLYYFAVVNAFLIYYGLHSFLIDVGHH
ncbi:hypothetical protein K1W69_03225 [Hoeflea sp. WL0058]|uniref:DoxX family membrane protein n=1 Tax=Flavimaribacter sediminis TaxID=2865987 RepID=A0AAE3CZR5_9HYPH|nr:hypothetical protein [Flavimaribacter sediminis]MBW8636187.1 hypothetical protein [Flavimaribacter sediminis]